ncbi:MAG: MFS transporter [Clostridium sp.]|nr:MFS transporter [Clostridium sp.]
MSDTAVKAAGRRNVFYGWTILFSLWAVYFLSTTTIAYGTSVATTRMVLELHMNEGLIGWSVSAFYAAMMIFSVPASVIAQKWGFRFALTLGAGVITAGCAVIFLFRVPVLLYVVLFFLMGAGCTLSGIVTGPGLVNAWFDRNKALPMSILMTAGAFGGFVMPMVSEQITNMAGWQACWMIYGGLAAISFLLAWGFIKNDPAVVGEVRDGREWRTAHKIPFAQSGLDPESGMSIREALKTRQFPTLCATLFGVRLLFVGSTSYLILYAVQNGVSSVQAAAALSCFHICGMLGRLSAGVKVKLPINVVNGIAYTGMFIGGILLIIAHTPAGFFLASAIIGFSYNYSYTLLTLMIPEYFGNRNYSIFFGTMNTVGSIGSTVGPILVSFIALASGYRLSYLILTAVTAVCALLAFVTPPALKQTTEK